MLPYDDSSKAGGRESRYFQSMPVVAQMRRLISRLLLRIYGRLRRKNLYAHELARIAARGVCFWKQQPSKIQNLLTIPVLRSF